MLCSFCLCKTKDGAPMHVGCLVEEIKYINAFNDLLRRGIKPLKQMCHIVNSSRKTIIQYDAWLRLQDPVDIVAMVLKLGLAFT